LNDLILTPPESYEWRFRLAAIAQKVTFFSKNSKNPYFSENKVLH
jgi:hypothetical protein